MGASLWWHFGPYDPDLRVAFEKTCEQVFRERDYLKGLPEDAQTIEELLDAAGESGTHSILDWYSAAERWAARVKPISEATLVHVFGSARPTRADIEPRLDSLWQYLLEDPYNPPDEGEYIVVYVDDEPSETLVFGATGD